MVEVYFENYLDYVESHFYRILSNLKNSCKITKMVEIDNQD